MKRNRKTLTVIILGAAALLIIAIATVVALYVSGTVGQGGYQRQIELAQQCLAVEDYDGAISAYYAAIDLDETRETAYLGLANIYETRGELNYLNYILETGYRNTNSAEIERRLDDLNASLLEQKTGDGSGLTYLNAPLLQRFAQATYGELNSYYGGASNQNDAGTSVTGETLSTGSFRKVTYTDVGITFYYPDGAISDSTQPVEIHLDDLNMLFNGMEDSLTFEELRALGLRTLEKKVYGSFGTLVTFELYDCIVWVACDDNGTITGRNVWNCIIPTVEDLIDQDASGGTHDVFGTIRSATTGRPIDAVQITVYNQYNAKVAECVNERDGAYRIEDLEPGYYTAELEAAGYVTETVDLYVDKWSREIEKDISVSPILSAGQIRIVLTWGQMPADLDSHLFTNSQHMFFANPVISFGSSVIAELDVDDQDGYGPETTTIYDSSQTYHFMVEDYYYSGLLGASGAQVKIYLPDGSNPIVIDVNPAVENVWDVCRIVNGQVEIINQPAESIG